MIKIVKKFYICKDVANVLIEYNTELNESKRYTGGTA